MYLFLDTETTGLPKNWNSSYKDVNNWPRIVQLGYILSDFHGTVHEKNSYIIKPNGFRIPYESTEIHGITNDFALANGIDLISALKTVERLVKHSSLIIGHNIYFDANVLGAEFCRNKMINPLILRNILCTMKLSKNFCALGLSPNYKWPTLPELYYKLFNLNLTETHDALDDIESTAECFWELKERNIINGNMSIKSKADWLMGFLDSLEHSETVTNKQIKVLREKLSKLLEEIGLDLIENEEDDNNDESDDIEGNIIKWQESGGDDGDLPF